MTEELSDEMSDELNNDAQCDKNVPKHLNIDTNMNVEEIIYENLLIPDSNWYENVLFIDESEASEHKSDTTDNAVYDKVKFLRNCIKEVNAIVYDKPDETPNISKYKVGDERNGSNIQNVETYTNTWSAKLSFKEFALSDSSCVKQGVYYADLVNTE